MVVVVVVVVVAVAVGKRLKNKHCYETLSKQIKNNASCMGSLLGSWRSGLWVIACPRGALLGPLGSSRVEKYGFM